MKKLLFIFLLTLSGIVQAAVPSISCTVPRDTSSGQHIAPLYIFVNCSATTDDGTSYPFHDLYYEHSFGDATAGVWGDKVTGDYGALASSRNFATGPMAGHVYETAGTFTIRSRACDATGCSQTTNTIIVTAADSATAFATTNTLCVGNSLPTAGSGGCPSGASVLASSDFDAAINNNIASRSRILFKRGDTFTASATSTIAKAGPGLIGAYGTGNAPLVNMSVIDAKFITVSSSATPTMSDWRIMDMYWDALSYSGTQGIESQGWIDRLTIINMRMEEILAGVIIEDSVPSAQYNAGTTTVRQHREIAVQDTTITPRNIMDGWRMYITTIDGAILGNKLGNLDTSASMGSHVLRMPVLEKGVISHNTLARPGENMLNIKLHSTSWCQSTSTGNNCISYDTDGPPPPPEYNYTDNIHPRGMFQYDSGYTEKVVISGNKLIGGDNPYLGSLAPQNTYLDERIRNIIYEGNWLVSGGGTQKGLLIVGEDITVRNNIAHMDAGAGKAIVMINQPGTAKPSNRVKIYNNTMHAVTASEFYGFRGSDSLATNISFVNNLLSAPAGAQQDYWDPQWDHVDGVAPTTINNNTLTNSPSTYFSTATPTALVDFRVLTTSDADTTGVAQYPTQAYDFFNCKDKLIQNRRGAAVPKANAQCKGGK